MSAPAAANQVVYACQYTASSGLNWENGKWASTGFILEAPFFLTTIDNNLTIESVGSKLLAVPSDVLCFPPEETQYAVMQICASSLGKVINFSFENMTGAIAQTFGGAMPTDLPENDSLTVSTFICTKVK